MKGLILKDLMCLRKQLTNFCFVMAGVLIASIMYVLSARYGNMAKVGQEMLNGNATQVDVRNIGSMVLVMFMLLPIASVGDMLYVFLADGKAGFGKVSATFPVPLKKRMLARFLTIYAMFGIGVADGKIGCRSDSCREYAGYDLPRGGSAETGRLDSCRRYPHVGQFAETFWHRNPHDGAS